MYYINTKNELHSPLMNLLTLAQVIQAKDPLLIQFREQLLKMKAHMFVKAKVLLETLRTLSKS